MTPERFQKAIDVLNRRQADLAVVMEHVHKPHNLAAIIRTCDAVGIPEIHAVTDASEFRMRQKAASGSGKWIDIHLHKLTSEAITALREKGLSIYCAHYSKGAMDFRDIDYTRPMAIVMGSELKGVSKEALAMADGEIRIPMLGMVQSLNVSVAAALILYEAQRQRQLAGRYDQVHIAPDQYQKTLFEWLHPTVTRYCQRHDLPYPELDDEGYIKEVLQDRNRQKRRLP
jgi:tRNA (guanosine-2'-O-)-methyltransferase